VSAVRVGLGFDVHPFATAADADADAGSERSGGDRPCILGGVVFEGRGLVGHSDADVVAHAVADAVSGAAGIGDIGSHFPDTDARWSGADSLDLLREMVGRAAEAGWRLVNADCTVIAEYPRISPLRSEMISALSGAAGAPVHVKATRPEGLGSLGRVEGIACLAVALVEEVPSP
jgi:2-C-methyl-D-erythritol 2,4-cyclodiphosphate synthase